jgi:hypothetical protein
MTIQNSGNTLVSTEKYTFSDGSQWDLNMTSTVPDGKQIITLVDATGSAVTSAKTPEEQIRWVQKVYGQKLPNLASGLTAAISAQSSALTAQLQNQIPPPNTEPVPPAAAATATNPEATPTVSGTNNQAQDDREPSGSSGNNNTNNTNRYTAKQTLADLTDRLYPGKRQDNPLSKFSSYTYNIALYIVTPEKINAFSNSGGILERGDDVFIIAQSGGINNTTENRALTQPGLGAREGYDYYIDDLMFYTVLPGAEGGASVSTTMSFKIMEPYSFTFLKDLAKASAKVNQASPMLQGSKEQPNAMQQNYIIGIRFYGYDINGNLVSNTNSADFTKYKNFLSDNNAVVERFFPIQINNLKFRLDGKMVTYSAEAIILSERAAFGEINGTIKKTCTAVASTVKEALVGTGTTSSNTSRGLFQILNEDGQNQKQREYVDSPTTYEVEFLKDDTTISNSRLIDDDEFSKKTAPMAPASDTSKSNIAESFKAVAINKTSKNITFNSGQTIVQAIDNLIVKSSYVTDALTEKNSENPETTSKDNSVSKQLKWYSINPVVTIKKRDDKIVNWSYNIKYEIIPFDIPYIRTQYKVSTSPYLGPYKTYGYWFTGENSEVISYEQQYDNLYYLTDTMSTSPQTTSVDDSKSKPPGGTQNATNSDKTGGKENKGSAIAENVRAQLYSPGDQTMAKMKILGDPDYLMTSSGVSQGISTSSYNKFYGSGLSINPFGGQVFIQVEFNTASDYQNDGLMDVSDLLQFYETGNVAAAGIRGIVYRVTHVESSFSAGRFTQNLDLLMVPESELILANKPENQAAQRAETTASNIAAGATTSAVDDARRAQAAQNTVDNAAKWVKEKLKSSPSTLPTTKNSAEYKAAVRAGSTPQQAVNQAKAAQTGGQKVIDA